MMWFGMEFKIELTKTTLPAREIRFAFHPESLSLTLSTMKLKDETLDADRSIGKPKYFPISSASSNPNRVLMSVLF